MITNMRLISLLTWGLKVKSDASSKYNMTIVINLYQNAAEFLIDNHLLTSYPDGDKVRYRITPEGEEMLSRLKELEKL